MQVLIVVSVNRCPTKYIGNIPPPRETKKKKREREKKRDKREIHIGEEDN